MGLYWVLLGFTGFLLGFTGFYWVLLGFIRFHWVLLGFIRFYWVLLGFTEFGCCFFLVRWMECARPMEGLSCLKPATSWNCFLGPANIDRRRLSTNRRRCATPNDVIATLSPNTHTHTPTEDDVADWFDGTFSFLECFFFNFYRVFVSAFDPTLIRSWWPLSFHYLRISMA